MCIRDRSIHIHPDCRCGGQLIGDIILERIIPVSYTHLDVYKRQISNPIGIVNKTGSELFINPWTHSSSETLNSSFGVVITGFMT